ncbi:TrmH family RNA methyltransferase [Phytoactinopolyspora halotolerans]|uniref:RNA methyltransferase n=1 Tax=Phytoactinopolyspora halotolerans TaxID=1981512 RepID=A0A6L9S9U5_9ACTN|nr:RNA methyltransferase [Phytoactinopolyspora halotolerans]NEE01849.1 RNA methyltransferase [Phytoactinopolyspora halotolerans]
MRAAAAARRFRVLTQRSERIRRARKLTRRAGRDKAGLFLAEGAQAVREAVRCESGRVVEVFATPAALDRQPEIGEMAAAAEIPVHLADDEALGGLSETVTPQGLVAVCRSVTVSLDELFAQAAGRDSGADDGGPRLLAVLADARDPGNAGTVIRCADAAGADAVALTAGSVDPQGGKAVRASAGSLFHLPVSTGASAEAIADAARVHGMTVLAADGAGERDLDEAEADGTLATPTAWLFGNEAWGLPAEIRAVSDAVVRVPIYGAAESLNLATAAAVCLYASARAQRAQRAQ